MKFRDLSIGDTFDFIAGDPLFVSFRDRCQKISARKYINVEVESRNRGIVYRVGSIDASVYHVKRKDCR